MLEITNVSPVENSSVNGATPANANDDLSFQEKLDSSQKQLEEKYKSQTLIPWGAVENMFQDFSSSFNSTVKFESALTKSLTQSNENTLNQSIAAVNSQNDQSNHHAAGADITQEENQRSNQEILEQTVIKVNLAGSPFFLDALMSTDLAKNITNRFDLELTIAKIVEQAKLLKAGARKTLEVSLSPEQLGKILLTVTKEKGVINVQIFAAEHAKDILEENISSLEESLKNANINIGSLTVSIGKRDNEEKEADREKSSPLDAVDFSQSLDSSQVNISVDAHLIRKLLGWLPNLSVYSKV